MEWIAEHLSSVSMSAIALAIIVAISKGFFSKAGEKLFKKVESSLQDPTPFEVDAHFEPHDVHSKSYAWVPENKKEAKASEGYSCYIDSDHQAPCFRIVIVYGSVTRKEYLMVRS